MTEAMRDTPAARLDRRAKYGHWDRFPSHPKPFYERLAGKRTNHVGKGGSFRVVDAHRQRLQRLDGPRRSLPDRLALYRAFHTVGIELAERVNDSYGVVGELREETHHSYLSLDWPATGMDRADYWRDLCELLVVEVYGLTYKNETAAFTNAVHDDVDVIETILLGLEAEHRSAYQDYQADEALQLIAWCHIATGACRWDTGVPCSELFSRSQYSKISSGEALRYGVPTYQLARPRPTGREDDRAAKLPGADVGVRLRPTGVDPPGTERDRSGTVWGSGTLSSLVRRRFDIR